MRISCFALGFFRYPVFFPFNNSCRARRLFIQPVSFTGSSIHVLASRNNSNRSRVSPLTFFPSIFIDCPPNVGRFTLLNRTRAVDFQRPLFIGRRSYPPPRDEIRPRFYPRNGRPGRYSDIAWLVFFRRLKSRRATAMKHWVPLGAGSYSSACFLLLFLGGFPSLIGRGSCLTAALMGLLVAVDPSYTVLPSWTEFLWLNSSRSKLVFPCFPLVFATFLRTATIRTWMSIKMSTGFVFLSFHFVFFTVALSCSTIFL